jgi:hypothetical protein
VGTGLATPVGVGFELTSEAGIPLNCGLATVWVLGPRLAPAKIFHKNILKVIPRVPITTCTSSQRFAGLLSVLAICTTFNFTTPGSGAGRSLPGCVHCNCGSRYNFEYLSVQAYKYLVPRAESDFVNHHPIHECTFHAVQICAIQPLGRHLGPLLRGEISGSRSWLVAVDCTGTGGWTGAIL